MKTQSKDDCPLNEPKCWAINCNCQPVPQSADVMTLEQCQSKVNSGYEIYSYSMTTHIRHVQAAELYASQFKAKADQLQAELIKLHSVTKELQLNWNEIYDELEQVKAERDKFRRALSKINNYPHVSGCCGVDECMYDERIITIKESVNKALQSTKQ